MTEDSQSDLKRKWDIHLVNHERNNLIEYLERVLEAIKKSSLDNNIQKALLIFYKEIKTYYHDQDLVNDSQTIKEYTKSYLVNHSMPLIQGVIKYEKPSIEVNRAVGELLIDLHTLLRQQSVRLIKALEQVEPYAKLTTKKSDEDFYSND
jgi:hypothetical protein